MTPTVVTGSGLALAAQSLARPHRVQHREPSRVCRTQLENHSDGLCDLVDRLLGAALLLLETFVSVLDTRCRRRRPIVRRRRRLDVCPSRAH